VAQAGGCDGGARAGGGRANFTGMALGLQGWRQTVKEGIAVELESELGYAGRFDYAFAGYESTLKDKQGKDVHRYRLTILLYDKSFSDTTRSGYEIDLQKMTGFSIGLLPLYKT
jgi:hypothetical protein